MVGVVLDRGREQGVDERSLSQSRFSGNLGRQTDSMARIKGPTMMVKAAPRLATILCLCSLDMDNLNWVTGYTPLVGELPSC